MFRRLCRLALAAGAAVAAIAAASAAALGAVPAQASTNSNLFASVNLNGTLAHGSGVTGVTHIGTGRYEVTFSANVQQCTYVATTINAYSRALQVLTAGGRLGTGRYDVTLPSSVKNCAYLATVGDPGNNLVFNPAGVYTGSGPSSRTVYIETKNPGGGLSDGIPFHLAVICPSAARTKIAVVNATGIPSRGSALTSSFTPSTGQYTLATSRALPACAAIATRGSVNTSVPFDLAAVEITPGPAPNTTGIQVRTLLFFGGNLATGSFHAAMIC